MFDLKSLKTLRNCVPLLLLTLPLLPFIISSSGPSYSCVSDLILTSDTRMPDSLPDVLPDAPGAMVGPASDAMDTSSSHDSADDTSTTADSSSNRVPPMSGRATCKPSCDAPDHKSMQWHEACVKDGGGMYS